MKDPNRFVDRCFTLNTNSKQLTYWKRRNPNQIFFIDLNTVYNVQRGFDVRLSTPSVEMCELTNGL